ncbi:MAG: TolC family outer membrane protein [Pseudomonadota bacterium]
MIKSDRYIRRAISRHARLSTYGVVLAVYLATNLGNFARGETIVDALVKAYHNNPTLNAERASVRAVNETVAIAKSGYRPTVSVNSEIGYSTTRSNAPGTTSDTELSPGELGVTVDQTLWDSNRTRNAVSSAISAASSTHENLRNTEQTVLLDAATAFLDVIRDRAILQLQRRNLLFLKEQLKAETSRKLVGEATLTDVAQAQAGQAGAQAEVSLAVANLRISEATYRQIVGDNPRTLDGRRIRFGFPTSLSAGVQIAIAEHPTILSARFDIDEAVFNVKSAESELLPRIDLEGKVARLFDQNVNTSVSNEYSVFATLEVPIFQAGEQSAIVRQNKELLGQRRIELDEAIDSVRADVISAYADFADASSSQSANQEQVNASRLALEGTVREREVGESTTLDVLSTQSTLIEAQIELENAKRNVHLAQFSILAAVGRLSISHISKQTITVNPEDHLEAVEDKWFGLRVVGGQ